MLWSVVFVTATLLDKHMYAVLWSVSEPGLASCVCLCEFPLSRYVVMRLIALGVGMCWHSLSLTLRALKGLRRSQWANMFSVLHAVPIEAFPVRWDQGPLELGLRHSAGEADDLSASSPWSSGTIRSPIKWRTEGDAVQSEPAFDPFCLMDEQPESARTRVLITPVCFEASRIYKEDPFESAEQAQLVWRSYSGSCETEIGCCGFPMPLASNNVAHRSDDVESPGSARTSARQALGVSIGRSSGDIDNDAVARQVGREMLQVDTET